MHGCFQRPDFIGVHYVLHTAVKVGSAKGRIVGYKGLLVFLDSLGRIKQSSSIHEFAAHSFVFQRSVRYFNNSLPIDALPAIQGYPGGPIEP